MSGCVMYCRDGLAPLRTELRALQKREQEVRQQLEAKEQQAADLQVRDEACNAYLGFRGVSN